MRELTIDSYKTNIMAVVFLLPAVLLFATPFYYLWHQSVDILFEIQFLKSHLPWLFMVLIIGVILHELLHALAYVFLTKGDTKNIRFGFIWKSLTPYCHYSQVVSVRQYRIALLIPALILGLLPLNFAFVSGNFTVFVFGVFFLLGAIGDLSIIWILRKEKFDTMLKDHPDEIGCIILDDELNR